MNKKGFFISIMTVFSLIFLLVFSINSSLLIESNSSSLNKSVSVETRHAVENMHFLIEKSLSQSLLDSSNTSSCSYPADSSSVKTALTPLLAGLEQEIEFHYGPELDCIINENSFNFDSSTNDLTADYSLVCSKSIVKGSPVFTVNLEKTFEVNKNLNLNFDSLLSTCEVTITDVQGNYVEFNRTYS